MTDRFDAIRRALLPLETPPAPPAWNHDRLLDLVGEGQPPADAAVLMGIRDLREPRMVFTLRREDLAHHAGQVSFPGGRTDHGDSGAIETALREAREEIALDRDAVEPLGFIDCLETVSGFCVTPVVARVAGDAVLVPQPGEVAKIFEVPLAFLLDPGNLRQFEFRARGEVRKVHEYVGVEPRIWGATAAMLVNLMQRMGVMK
jgi:8-oxo-dGTP pyrophosphatase MutT (NUDIX family)